MFSSRFSDIFCDFSPQHPHCEFLQTPSCATMNRTSIICPQVSAMEVCSFQSPVLLRRKILDLVGICPPRIFSDGHGSRRRCQDRPVTICHKRSWIPWCVAHMPAAAESFTPGQRYRHSCRLDRRYRRGRRSALPRHWDLLPGRHKVCDRRAANSPVTNT